MYDTENGLTDRWPSQSIGDSTYNIVPSSEGDEESLSKQEEASSLRRETGWTLWLTISAITASFGCSFAFGYNIGVINSPHLIITRFYNASYIARYNQTKVSEDTLELLWSWTVSIFVAGGMLGSFASGLVSNWLGRKRAIIAIQILEIIGGIMMGLTKVCYSPELLMCGRLVVGIYGGLVCGLVPIYLAEISPKNLRGATGTLHQLALTVGILVAQVLGLKEVLGTEGGWPVLLGLAGLPALLALFIFPLCPDSPNSLLLKNNDEKGAREVLQKLRNVDDVDDEMDDIRKMANQQDKVQTLSVKELLCSADLRLPLVVGVVMQLAQQLSGINAVFFYSREIFTTAKIPADTIPYVIVGTGAINVLMTLITVPMMDRSGRRPLLLWPMLVISIDFILLVIALNMLVYQAMSYVAIGAVILFIVCFAVGLGPIPFIYVAEIFSQEARGAAVTVCMFVNHSSNFVLAMSFPFIQKAMGAYTFLIFVVIVVGAAMLIFFRAPETKNRTLKEIEMDFDRMRGRRQKALHLPDNPDDMPTTRLMPAEGAREGDTRV